MAARQRRPAVERDDARFVDHLVANDHHAGSLHDLVAVVVDGRQERSHHAARDAAVVEAAVEMAVGLAPLQALTPRARLRLLIRLTLLTLRRQRRLTAVGRIDDERRLPRRLAGLLPVRLRRGRAPDRTIRIHLHGEHVDLGDERFFLLLDRLGALRELFVREHVPRPEPCGALERHSLHLDAWPEPLKIGVAPRRLRLDEAWRGLGNGKRHGISGPRGIGGRLLAGDRDRC